MPKVGSVKAVVTPPVVTKKTNQTNMAQVVAQNLGIQKTEKPASDSFAMTLMYNFGLTIEKKY